MGYTQTTTSKHKKTSTMEKIVPPTWSHQREAAERAKDGKPLALFMDIGVGKTRTQIEILKWHIAEGRRRILIFAPPVVLGNWKNEILKYSDIPEHWITVLYSSGIKREKLLGDIQIATAKIKDNPYIIITNYESVGMSKVFAKLSFMPFDILVLDESHYCKAHDTIRTKKITQLSTQIKYRYIMTGTPVLNTPMDLFSQYKILFGHFPQLDRYGNISEERGIDTFYAFRGKYFYDKNASMPSHVHFYNWAPKPGALKALHTIVDKTACVAKKKDVLDLPLFINVTREVELGKDQKKAYDEMFNDFITYVNDDACVAQLAITKGMKLMQIISGFLHINEEKTHAFVDNPRMEKLEELLLQLHPEHKVIVWAQFKWDHKAIVDLCRNNNIGFAFLTGDINPRQKSEMVEKFNRLDSCRVMVAQQQAGGIGVNLTASDTSIYYSRNFSLGGDIQSEGRNYRGGSEIHKCITRIDLVTKGTIDEVILEALANKEMTAESLLRKIKDANK